ncbi:MAG: hydantoinase/oxoprolinase family protein [Pseudomonadota bacterium]
MRIGIDVGGTNTDAVLMDGQTVVSWHKTPTTADVSGGIEAVLGAVMADAEVSPDQITAVMIGTTHFTNAVVERERLLEVAVLRLGLPATTALMPFADWPADLKARLGGHTYLLHGGVELDGRPISPLDPDEIRKAAADIKSKGLKTAAVTSVFSPVDPGMEDEVAAILRAEVPGLHVTLSREIGRIGFIERENATIMNACLVELAARVVRSFENALKALDIKAPFFISQNDGTLMDADYVARYPVLTFASGPTNSMRGAAFLSGVKEAMVVDIGGTTSDVGMLRQGFPRESSVAVDIGGVRTNFRMPDVLAIGLGGGSRVRDDGARVGPDSVGFALTEDALVFGGETLTTTDIIVAKGSADIGDPAKVAQLDPDLVTRTIGTWHQMVDTAVDRMKTSAEALPVILVGGGAVLITEALPAASEVIHPPHATVANAIGAAIAQVGGVTDRVFSLEGLSRDDALAMAKDEATRKAVEAGADPQSIEIVDIEEVPLAYLPSSATRIRVKAVGDLTISGA